MKRMVMMAAAMALLAAPLAAVEDDDPRVTPVVRAYRKVSAAVVNVSAKRIVSARMSLFGADPFDEIFPSPLVRRVPVQSLGSGVLISPDGYIVTNDHVVRRAQEITVRLADDREFPARVISADPEHDLAVLRMERPEGETLAYLPLGRSDDLMVGETVIAVGNPMGYANSVTTGVLSAVRRTLEFDRGLKYEGLLQTDAPINPGNSGGPLLNLDGELIGINTAIRADAQNIGFAIPVDLLAEDFGRLLDFERINRVIFGATVRQQRREGRVELDVIEVRPGTPADGKLVVGDRVMGLNGRPMGQITDFICGMMVVKAGEAFDLLCLRDGKPVHVKLALAVKPKPDGKALAERLFGITLRKNDRDLARQLRLSSDRGLLVVGVDSGGPADRLGIHVKDILFQVDRLYVDDLDDLGMVLEEVASGDGVKIGILRGNVAAWAQITAAEPTSAPASRPGD